MFDYFRRKANVTAFDIDLDVVAEGFLVVLPSDEFSRFLDAEITCWWVIMVPANQLSPNNFRNVGQTLMMQDSIEIFPVSAKFFRSDFSYLTIFHVQLY